MLELTGDAAVEALVANGDGFEATLEALQGPGEPASDNIGAIAEFIRPSVESVLDSVGDADAEEIVGRAVRANVRAFVESLAAVERAAVDRRFELRGVLLEEEWNEVFGEY